MERSVMVIKLALLLLLTSCGKEIKLKNNNLASLEKLSQTDVKSYQKTGTFIKGSPSRVLLGSENYPVSIYSSHEAQKFMASVPEGGQVQILFTGGIINKEMVLETVQKNER